MSDLSPMELEKLILGYEELEPADKAVADHFLQQKPELAVRLKWHQDKETQARDAASGTGEFCSDELLDPADEQAQQESLRKILAAIDLHLKTQTPSPVNRLRSATKWMLPLAAVLALVILVPRGGVQNNLLKDFTVTQIILNDDGSRGTNHPVPAEGVLHSGQAFALDFTLTEDSYVIVYHVGPAGQVSRVYPESISDGAHLHEGATEHQIPSPDSGEVWVLGTETGIESFLMAVGSEWPMGLDRVQIDFDSTDRGEIMASLSSQLEELRLQVDLYEFEHID